MAELQSVQLPIHWAIGFFDGVHTGHRRVMHSAATPGALRGVLTFCPHPLALLCPERRPLLITPEAEQKADLIARVGGADVLLTLPFTPELAALSPEAFLDALCAASRVAGISVGANWRFGSGGGGTPDLLRREGERRGFRVCVCELEQADAAPVSSRRIRAALADGCLEQAVAMLGHAYALCGCVRHGRHLARQLGFPTANIDIHADTALPPFGAYRVLCHTPQGSFPGVANLGLRPTVHANADAPVLEVHLPGQQLSLYGCRLVVEMQRFLRPECRFASVDELRARVVQDIIDAGFAAPRPV